MRVLIEATLIVEIPDDTDTLDQATYPGMVDVLIPFGTVDYREVHTTKIVTPADANCDFCGGTPTYLYEADNFLIGIEINGVEEGSAGGWLACAECSWCVETNDYPTLQGRALHRFAGQPGYEEMFALLDGMYAGFREHRRGERKVLA